jgi:isopenicillin N synthase-like dioxygenase
LDGALRSMCGFRDHVAAQIDWAASEFGFFYVVGHRVDLSAIERLIALSRTLRHLAQ